MKTVKLSHNPKNGQVYTANKELSKKDGKEYGWYIVRSLVLDNSGGVTTVKQRSAIKSISREAFNAATAMGLMKAGDDLNGQIIFKEALAPFFPGQSPKTAGKDGTVCTKGGLPIYRQYFFVEDQTATDEAIAHDNVITGSNVAAGADAELEKQG